MIIQGEGKEPAVLQEVISERHRENVINRSAVSHTRAVGFGGEKTLLRAQDFPLRAVEPSINARTSMQRKASGRRGAHAGPVGAGAAGPPWSQEPRPGSAETRESAARRRSSRGAREEGAGQPCPPLVRPRARGFGPEQERAKAPLRGARGSLASLMPNTPRLGAAPQSLACLGD